MVLLQPRGSTTRSKCHLPATVTRPCACAWFRRTPSPAAPTRSKRPGPAGPAAESTRTAGALITGPTRSLLLNRGPARVASAFWTWRTPGKPSGRGEPSDRSARRLKRRPAHAARASQQTPPLLHCNPPGRVRACVDAAPCVPVTLRPRARRAPPLGAFEWGAFEWGAAAGPRYSGARVGRRLQSRSTGVYRGSGSARYGKGGCAVVGAGLAGP